MDEKKTQEKSVKEKRAKRGLVLIIVGTIICVLGLLFGGFFSFLFLTGATICGIGIYYQCAETNKNDKRMIIIAVVSFVLAIIIGMFGSCSCSGSGGDGITTCKNCGRKEISWGGMCERCADDFLEWQDKLD